MELLTIDTCVMYDVDDDGVPDIVPRAASIVNPGGKDVAENVAPEMSPSYTIGMIPSLAVIDVSNVLYVMLFEFTT